MKALILLAVSLFTTFCFAQNNNDEDKRLSFGYDYGQSYPKGNFKMTNQSKLPLGRLLRQDTTHLNGYAQKGVHYDIYLSYKIVRHLHIMLAVCGDQNSFDINTLNSQYIALLPPNTAAVFTGDNYYIVQYLIGPSINIPIVKKLSAEVKVLGGLTTANYPGLTYIGLVQNQDELFTIPKSSGFGYNVSLGLEYKAVNTRDIDLGLHLNVNYTGSTITYPTYTITAYTPGNVFINSYTYNVHQTMAINMLQITFGISLEFQNLFF